MTSDSGGKRSFLGLFEIEEGPKKSTPKPSASAASPIDMSDGPPREISTLVPGGTSPPTTKRASARTPSPTPVGDSRRVAQLVEDVQKYVPQENATLQLVNAMKSLEGILEDPAARKAAALKVLATQGITEESVMAGSKEVQRAIDDRLNELLAQSDDVRQRNVAGKQAEAVTLREQNAESRRQIEAIQAEISERERQAAQLDQEASQNDSDLSQFKTDVETARIAARELYGV